MKFNNLHIGMKVVDRWFWDWGIGTITKKLKTVCHINFSNKGLVVFDKSHCQFLNREV